MAIFVRERRHQQALRLSLPPPMPATKFQSPTYSPRPSPATSHGSPVITNLFDFEKLAVLGHGNGGMVYKVLHKRTSSIYALKVLTGIRQQAAREAEILKLVDSPYIVRCYGIFDAGEVPMREETGDLSVVMEYMEGGSMQDLLRARRRLSEREISSVVRQVLRGLHYLHSEMMIVHSDIKPSNLLVSHDGEVKIADFGASHVMVEDAESEWSHDGCMGTCAYMSPERFDRERWGGGGREGFAGDVWAVGVVAFECHVGRFPLVGAGQHPDWATLMCVMCLGERVEVPETASPKFRDFLKRCLEKDWRKRATVDELLQHSFLI